MYDTSRSKFSTGRNLKSQGSGRFFMKSRNNEQQIKTVGLKSTMHNYFTGQPNSPRDVEFRGFMEPKFVV